MKPSRSWFQYSLQSLLALLTAVAVWLGIAVNKAREQRQAVQHIEKAGGLIAYDCKPNTRVEWEKRDRPFMFHLFHTASRVGITSDRIADETCSEIARLPRLTMVLLDGSVSDQGVSWLTNLTDVESLLLSRTEITNRGVSQLQRMKSLKILDLGKTRLTDANLEELARLSNLFVLRAALDDVSNRGLNYFQRSLPRCEVIDTDR